MLYTTVMCDSPHVLNWAHNPLFSIAETGRVSKLKGIQAFCFECAAANSSLIYEQKMKSFEILIRHSGIALRDVKSRLCSEA